MGRSKYLHSAAYRLGENRVRLTDVTDYASRLKELALPMGPRDVANSFFFTTADIYRLVSDAIAETMRRSGMDSREIHCVIVCSSHFSDVFHWRNRNLAKAITRHELSPKLIQGVSGAGCVDLIRGVGLACGYLDRGLYENILVIGLEAFGETKLTDRIVEYALVSDAAVSFMVSSSMGRSPLSRPMEIIAEENRTILSKVGGGMSIADVPVYAQCISEAISAIGVRLADVTKVFGNNIFTFFKTVRESCAGILQHQMYLPNVERVGHCLSCDSILNLVDYGIGSCGNYFLCFAEAEGHAGVIVAREVTDYA